MFETRPDMNPWKQNPDPFFSSKPQFLKVVYESKREQSLFSVFS
jgi:hypothetical protein